MSSRKIEKVIKIIKFKSSIEFRSDFKARFFFCCLYLKATSKAEDAEDAVYKNDYYFLLFSQSIAIEKLKCRYQTHLPTKNPGLTDKQKQF